MASELSSFISEELSERGYKGDRGNDKQFLQTNQSSTTIGMENSLRLPPVENNKKQRRLIKYIGIGAIVIIIFIVWISLMATASNTKKEDSNNNNSNSNNNYSSSNNELKSSLVMDVPSPVPYSTGDVPAPVPSPTNVVFEPTSEANLEEDNNEDSKKYRVTVDGQQCKPFPEIYRGLHYDDCFQVGNVNKCYVGDKLFECAPEKTGDIVSGENQQKSPVPEKLLVNDSSSDEGQGEVIANPQKEKQEEEPLNSPSPSPILIVTPSEDEGEGEGEIITSPQKEEQPVNSPTPSPSPIFIVLPKPSNKPPPQSDTSAQLNSDPRGGRKLFMKN